MASAPKKSWSSDHENDAKTKYGGRDLIGYGRNPPQPHWPNKAKCALNFVVNFEEGAEKCLLHGDDESECLLSDIPGAEPKCKHTTHGSKSFLHDGVCESQAY